MAVCKFWRQGNCRNGDRCRFEHPLNQGSSQAPTPQHQNHNQPQNRYASLGSQGTGFGSGPRSNNNNNNYNNNNNNYNNNNNNNNSSRPPPSGGNSRNSRRSQNYKDRPYGITRQSVEDDLTIERPQWVMSVYGPGKDAPVQLFGGIALEQSFEEMRVQHYLHVAAGIPQQTAQMEQELATQVNQQVQNALVDLDGALDYIVNGAQTHPNRLDMIAETDRNISSTQPRRHGDGVFARSSTRAPPLGTSGFGFNSQQPAFGAQSFGQAPQPFNQGPAFGQSTGMNQINPLGASSGFGSSTGFGLPTMGTNSQQTQQSPFGQPATPQVTAFGQPVQQASGALFGQIPNPAPLGFAQQSQQQPQQAPMQSTFGQPQMSQTTAVFGQPEPPIVAQQFGQPPYQQINNGSLGGVPQPNGPVFDQPAHGMMNGSLGMAQSSQQNPAIFGQINPGTNNNPGFGATPTPMPSGFPNQSQNIPPPNNTLQQPNGTNGTPMTNVLTSYNPNISSYSTHDASGRLLTWKGKSVSYIQDLPHYQQDNEFWERIWFPDGVPKLNQVNVNNVPAEAYTEDVKKAYRHVMDYGSFEGGNMPEVPPMIDMARWDV